MGIWRDQGPFIRDVINAALVLLGFRSLREDSTVMGRWLVTSLGHRVGKGVCRVGTFAGQSVLWVWCSL